MTAQPTTARPTAAILPVIKVGGALLPDDAKRRVVRAMVDTHLHLPGMFEISFIDDTGEVISAAGLSIGTAVQILGSGDGGGGDGGGGDAAAHLLIDGEVTSIEGIFEQRTFITVVRGYDRAHRLQRARRTRTFLNMKDSDIASQLASEAGLPAGQIDTSAITHVHLGQCDQTDWEFLSQRAREVGFETGMKDGAFYFRKASTVSASGDPVPLVFGQGLRAFRPRLTAGNLAPEAEVRVWDPDQASVVSARDQVTAGSISIAGHGPAAAATPFTASGDAYVLADRPAATGAAITAAAGEIAASLAEHLGSTFAEAEGDAAGNPAIQAGVALRIDGVPSPFAGTWLVTRARHVFSVREAGYHTGFEVSGRQERSLLGLASAASTRPAPPRIPGLTCGIVSNANDPAQRGRVKVTLPWLAADYESDWAPVLQFGAGKRSGALFLPEVGDEVLIGFEFGDPRRPYVLGGIINAATGYDLGGPAVRASGQAGEVVRRGFVSPAGNRLVFHDELPPGSAGPPTASDLVLGTQDGSLCLKIDQAGGTVTLTCQPEPPASQAAAGQLTIQCGNAGTINITAGPGGSVNIDGGNSLSLKAQASIDIESSGQVAIKGAQIMLN